MGGASCGGPVAFTAPASESVAAQLVGFRVYV